MAEANLIPPKRISATAFKRYLDDRTGNQKIACPVCAHDEWTLFENETTHGFGFFPLESNGSVPITSYVPFVMIQCQHCAHSMFFTRGPVESWIEENPDA